MWRCSTEVCSRTLVFTGNNELPLSHASGIDVYEIRLLIVADATALELQSHIAQFCRVEVRQTDIDGRAKQVLAMLGNPVRFTSQHVIGSGRAIRGDYLERACAAGGLLDFEENIKYARVHFSDIPGSEVSQKVI